MIIFISIMGIIIIFYVSGNNRFNFIIMKPLLQEGSRQREYFGNVDNIIKKTKITLLIRVTLHLYQGYNVYP
ncbi:hypothetical protein C5469_17150 [Photorhabdus cinerea]|uniref:Uncharacterized protein n=1 Tax=Photorhabdus cinerea TaxID=471575 RepID=A0A7X5QGE1_9GAMM|nr:hypothetical protein [Photorhabdus cinerea]